MVQVTLSYSGTGQAKGLPEAYANATEALIKDFRERPPMSPGDSVIMAKSSHFTELYSLLISDKYSNMSEKAVTEMWWRNIVEVAKTK